MWANQADPDILGFAREEYVGHKVTEFHADRDGIEHILQRLRRNETLRNYEARLQHKDGSIRYVLITSNMLWREGELAHTRCYTRDITERRQAEEALRESELRCRLWVEAHPAVSVEIGQRARETSSHC